MNVVHLRKHPSRLKSNKPWIMRQTWNHLFFVHWPVSLPSLRARIPPSLNIDTYDGQAWISIVFFMMAGIYFRGLPNLFASRFPEINVRTYVTYNNKPGVYFLSLDAEHWVTYTLGKLWYRIPYHHSCISIQMNDPYISFESIRKDRKTAPAKFKGTFYPLSEVFKAEPKTLDYWLTERYYLYSSNSAKNIFRAEINHLPWQLQKAEAKITTNTLISSLNIPPSSKKPVIQFSKGIDAVFSNIKRL